MTTTKIYNQARQDWNFWSAQLIYQMGPVLPLNSPFHVLFIYHFTCRGNPTLLKSGLGRPWVQIFCLCHLWRHRSFGASYHQVDMVQDNIWDIREIWNHNALHCNVAVWLGPGDRLGFDTQLQEAWIHRYHHSHHEPHHRQHEPYHWCNICGNRFGCNTVFGLAQKADCVANQEKLDQYGQKIAQ